MKPNLINSVFILFFIISQKRLIRAENSDTLSLFYQNYVKAQIDSTSYKAKLDSITYTNYFSTDELRSKFFYVQNPTTLPSYIIAFPNESFFKIKIKIEPCKEKYQYCCEDLAICGDDIIDLGGEKTTSDGEVTIDAVEGGGDIDIAWIANGFLPTCIGDFEDENCGSFLEIHRPGSDEALYKKKLETAYTSGYKTAYLSTKTVCAGRYDIFFVFKIRGSSNLMYVKPFLVKYPSCTCDTSTYTVKESGYQYKCEMKK